MTTSVKLQSPRASWEVPPVRPLDEAVWQTWVLKGRAQDRRSSASLVSAVKYVSAAALLSAACVWSSLAPFDVLVRFIVTLGAMTLMVQEFQARRYAFSGIFAALVLVYNPLLPAFDFSGDWNRAVVTVSAVPFIASLAWRNAPLAPNV